MSDYQICNPTLGGIGPITRLDSAPAVPLGMIVGAFDRAAASSGGNAYGEFEYCRGSNVASAGQFVQIQNGSAVLLAAANSALNFPVGVACGVLSATNVYGFVQVKGRADYCQGTNTGITVGVPQYICAGTPGIVNSNVVAGNRVQGLVVPATLTATSLGTNGGYVYELNRPYVAGLTASL